MVTPLTDVYEMFLEKVNNEYKFSVVDETTLEKILKSFLKTSIVYFKTACIKDLSIDEENYTFVSELNYFEKEILAKGMMVAYIDTKVNDNKDYENILTPTEYKSYSKANHIDKKLLSKREAVSELSNMIVQYGLSEMDDE